MKSSSAKVGGALSDRMVSIVTLILGALLVAFLWQFNRGWIYYDSVMLGNVIGLFFIPILAIIFMGEEPAIFGFALADSRRVRVTVLVLFVLLLPAFFLSSRMAGFQSYYPIFRQFASFPSVDNLARTIGQAVFTETNIRMLLYGWVSYGLYMFCWEFFFRGFLLFGLARTIQWPAVIIQAVAFGVLHIGKPIPEVALSFGAGIVLGMLALKAKSFIPGFLLHFAAFVTFDIFILMNRPH